MKDIMAPINAFLFLNQDMNFNYNILTTIKCYHFFFLCFDGLIPLVNIFYEG